MENNLEWILGKRIKSIHLKRDRNYNNNIVSICLNIEDAILVFTADSDTDTIIMSRSVFSFTDYKEEEFFNRIFVNEKIISYWYPCNNLGYFDTFILGLEKFIPTAIFSIAASFIKIGNVNYD
jgi:hypothetical protein